LTANSYPFDIFKAEYTLVFGSISSPLIYSNGYISSMSYSSSSLIFYVIFLKKNQSSITLSEYVTLQFSNFLD